MLNESFEIFGYANDYLILFDLFDYPEDILVDFFSQWNVIKDICSLDTAYCNKFRRQDFKRLLTHKGFTISGIECEEYYDENLCYLFLDWIFVRKIKLCEIFLLVDDFQDFDLLCKLDLTRTTRIKLIQYSPSDGDLSILVNSCVSLEHLILQNCKVSNIIIKSIAHCLHQLKYLNIFSSCSDFTMDAILILAANCKSLEKLCLIYSRWNYNEKELEEGKQQQSTTETLLELFKNNLNLRAIDLDLTNGQSLCKNTSLSLMNDIVVGHCCQYLTKCDLKWYGKFNIAHLTSFLTCCGLMQTFSLEVTDLHNLIQTTSSYNYLKSDKYKCLKISDHSSVIQNDILRFFDNHNDFTEVALINTGPIKDQIICKIAHTSSKSLRTMTLDNCGEQFTHDSILELFALCQSLHSIYLNKCDHLNYIALAPYAQTVLY